MSAKPLRLAIVGLGGMGQEHARKLSGLGEIALSGCFDVDPEKRSLAARLGLKPYPSLDAILGDPDVEGVLIATPNDCHKGIAVAALRSGKHVICEKPVALSTAELDDIVAAAEKASRVFMVHQNRRWDEDYLTMKRILDAETLGKLYHLESRVHGSRGIPGDWRKRASHGGGMLLDWGVHLIDRIVFLVPGKIVRLYCRLNYPTGQEVDEGFHLFLTFEGGQTALVEVSTCHYQSLPLWMAMGDRGTALIQDWELRGGIVARAGASSDAAPIAAGAGLTKTMAPRDAYSEERLPLPIVRSDVRDFYRNFAAAARGEAEPVVKNAEVRRVMRLIEAAFESHRRGEVVRFES